MPAVAQRSVISVFLGRFTFEECSRMISMIDSTGLVQNTIASDAPVILRQVTVRGP